MTNHNTTTSDNPILKNYKVPKKSQMKYQNNFFSRSNNNPPHPPPLISLHLDSIDCCKFNYMRRAQNL